ncbi:MAG: hypothetical protein H6603_10695 [Flavobacteriales bacterium]|nr:hypothetical protein [Flavobacteriales bacterium]
MLISEIKSNYPALKQKIERYLNDGSPSGFTTIYTTSPETSPFGSTSWFNPFICLAPPENFKTFGTIPSWPGESFGTNDDWILVHPDMADNVFFRQNELKIFIDKGLKVSPTASGRTVQIVNKTPQDYVKLHYEGILGRVRRELPYNKAIGGPETSIIISEAIDRRILPNELSLFKEPGARILENKVDGRVSQWGMVWREGTPYGLSSSEATYIIPIFSLFSFDRLATYEFPILKQIIDHSDCGPDVYVFDKLITPILKCYFELILKLGLQAEWNAQNLLIAFNNDFSETKLVMRDLESVDKDITLMEQLNIKHQFDSYPYKCLLQEQYNYTIKHSFMYDFKLGDYILEPLATFLYKYYKVNFNNTQNRIREIAQKYIDQLPTDFFPKKKWYSFEKVLVDQSVIERPYLAHNNPKFRFK